MRSSFIYLYPPNSNDPILSYYISVNCASQLLLKCCESIRLLLLFLLCFTKYKFPEVDNITKKV